MARAVALVLFVTLGGCMSTAGPAHDSIVTVRYQVADIERSGAFYKEHLSFQPAEKFGTAFAAITRGGLRLILSGPGSSGSRPMPDGRKQEPGGWNRLVLYVDDLASQIASLKKAGVKFRNEVEAGPGGKQIMIEDPDGNPIELHEAPKSAPR